MANFKQDFQIASVLKKAAGHKIYNFGSIFIENIVKECTAIANDIV